MTLEPVQGLARIGVPEDYHVVGGTGRRQFAVAGERGRPDPAVAMAAHLVPDFISS